MDKVISQKDIVAFETADQVLTFKCAHIGYLTDFLLVIPNFTTAASLIVTINDKDTYLIYTSASINDNQTVLTHLTNKLAVGIDDVIKLTLNAASGGAHTVVSKLYIEVG